VTAGRDEAARPAAIRATDAPRCVRVHHRDMNARTNLVAVAAAVAVTMSGTSLAQASPSRAKATTTVTIKAEGVDLSGKVKSPRQACITDRKVILVKQIGARGGGDDINFASDTASSDGSWSTGTTGTAGRFYSKVKPTAQCQGDTSPTVRAHR
jgi:hypothetical protein